MVFGLFSIFPDIYSLVLSFKRYAGFGPTRPVGLANYRSLLAYSSFWTEVENTLFYWVAHAVIVIPLAFVMAMVLRSKLIRGARIWKPLIFLPQVMSVVAVSLVWQTLFSTQYGVLNSLLGIHVAWLTDYALARWIVVLLLVWQGLGFWFVVFLAGLTAVDPAVLEAAVIDGAGVIRRTVSVLIPLMRPVILFAVVIDAIGSMSLYTQPNVLLSQGGALANPSVSTLSNLEVGNLPVRGIRAKCGGGLVALRPHHRGNCHCIRRELASRWAVHQSGTIAVGEPGRLANERGGAERAAVPGSVQVVVSGPSTVGGSRAHLRASLSAVT